MTDQNFTGAEAIRKKAEMWWYPEGPFWPLHKMNRWRLAYITNHICEAFGRDASLEKPLDGLRLLDVGCGGGILSEALHEKGAVVIGIDPLAQNIQVAQHHAMKMGYGIDYRQATAADLTRHRETFDATIGMEVIEHVADQRAFVADMAKMTRSDGLVFMSTISRTLPSLVFAKFAAEYILGILPKGTHKWREFVKPSEMRDYLQQAGCQHLHTQGVRLNPFKRRFSYTSLTWMNYMQVARKL